MVCAYNGFKKKFFLSFFFFPKILSDSDVESVEPRKVSKKRPKKSSKKDSKKRANTKPLPTVSPDESIPERASWDFNFYMEQGTIFEGQYPWERLATGMLCICNFDVVLK